MSTWPVLPLLLLVSCLAPAASGAAAPRDRDHDRLPDRWEKRYHLSTSKKSAMRDADHDRLRNLREYRLRTHPRRKDTDGDGLRDGVEVRRYHTNPRRKDTDGDGYGDGAEIRAATSPHDRRSHPSETPTPHAPAPAPRSAGFPDASSTGVPAGTSLTTVNGNVTLNTPGQAYEDRLVNGCITVNAANVVIRRTKVVCRGLTGIWSGSTGLAVEDTEIDCGDAVGRTAITPANYTARRVDAHGCENILWADDNVLIEDSYIHDPVGYDPVLDPHTDAVQVPGSNVTIRHNTIYGDYVGQSSFGNSAITTGGDISNLLIQDNLLAGGGYTLRCEGSGANSNYRVIGNRFSRIFAPTVGGFGPVNLCRTNATEYSGNVYHETGQPL